MLVIGGSALLGIVQDGSSPNRLLDVANARARHPPQHLLYSQLRHLPSRLVVSRSEDSNSEVVRMDASGCSRMLPMGVGR